MSTSNKPRGVRRGTIRLSTEAIRLLEHAKAEHGGTMRELADATIKRAFAGIEVHMPQRVDDLIGDIRGTRKNRKGKR